MGSVGCTFGAKDEKGIWCFQWLGISWGCFGTKPLLQYILVLIWCPLLLPSVSAKRIIPMCYLWRSCAQKWSKKKVASANQMWLTRVVLIGKSIEFSWGFSIATFDYRYLQMPSWIIGWENDVLLQSCHYLPQAASPKDCIHHHSPNVSSA